MGKLGHWKVIDEMKFTKMQGAGNDYIYINCFEELPPADPSGLSRQLSDRHFGIGSDGIILILPSSIANVKMEIYNADGSRAQTCGNGLRCVGKYAYEHGICTDHELIVETLAGLKKLTLNVENGTVRSVRVNMGAPIFKASDIPVITEEVELIEKPVKAEGRTFLATAVSMGNPHCVIFMDTLDGLDLIRYGAAIENHSIFPDRTNVEFAQIEPGGAINVRVWERGSGETMACGSGASAVFAAAAKTNRCGDSTLIRLRGGELLVQLDKASGEIYLTGGAESVFDGII